MPRTTKIQRFDAESFTSQVLDEMKARGVTHEALARETGLSVGMVTKMRKDGRRPTTDAFLALCHWLGADPMRFHMERRESSVKASPFSGLTR